MSSQPRNQRLFSSEVIVPWSLGMLPRHQHVVIQPGPVQPSLAKLQGFSPSSTLNHFIGARKTTQPWRRSNVLVLRPNTHGGLKKAWCAGSLCLLRLFGLLLQLADAHLAHRSKLSCSECGAGRATCQPTDACLPATAHSIWYSI